MKFIGTVQDREVFAKWNNAHNQLRIIIDGKNVAVYDADVMNILEDPIVFRNNTIANELSALAKDQIQQLARTVDVDELKEDEEKYGDDTRDNIAKVLEIPSKELVSITEIDLDEEIKEEDNSKVTNITE